ncbi:uncharacterized protein KRP23_1654 [Phytophthora ramorum]|uniref:uncharacterized protein n=1 Tax=Phytophthora ramorum TaxID=164328 RepID=UPI00309A5710|nr:hypothetical protein KRP23_1654 [Phytophthora ramorum]
MAPATRTLATAAPSEVVAIDEALLDPEEEEAAVEEDADADADVVSVVEEVDESVIVSEEPEVLLVMVTSVSVLALETSTVALADVSEPTVVSPKLDALLSTNEVEMAMSLDELPTFTVPAVLLANTSNKVSSVSVEAAELEVLVELRTSVGSSKLSSSGVNEPEPELTALVDADATVDVELETSCAQAALTARAQTRVTRKSCMVVEVFTKKGVNSTVECAAPSQIAEWQHWSATAFNQSTTRSIRSCAYQARQDKLRLAGRKSGRSPSMPGRGHMARQ